MGALANVVTIQAANFASLMNEQEREKKYAQGRELVIRAKELDPDDPSIYVAMGLYAAAHNDMAGWRRAAEARLALDPKNPSAYNNMAMAELDAGAPQRAVELLTQAIALDPRHPADMVLVNMGAAHFMLGDDAAAVDWSLKAAASAPALPLPYVYLALAYTQMGDETRAQTALAALHQVDPQFSADNLGPPQALSPPAYREFWEKRLMPAASKLGLAPAR